MENYMTQTEMVLEALSNGEELTARQISSRYGVRNPTAVITNLRQQGYAVYLNTHRNSKGETVSKYRLGRPTKAIVAAGYKALGAAAFA
jgi:predicted transcriptional regulator